MILEKLKERLTDLLEVFDPLEEVEGFFTQVRGNNGIWELRITIEPTTELARLLRLNAGILSPRLEELGISDDLVRQWVNAKNSDLNFGRYYVSDGRLYFEEALPVLSGKVCWDVFDEYLRIALFSVDDAIGQLTAVIEKIKGGRR